MTMKEYLILDRSRTQYVCVWWKPNRRGYTHYLAEAGRYTAQEAAEIINEPMVDDLEVYHAKDLPRNYSALLLAILERTGIKPAIEKKAPPMPTPAQYGYEEPTLLDEGGWLIEGGEEQYYEDLQNWKARYEKNTTKTH
jgi:hypothetical protein